MITLNVQAEKESRWSQKQLGNGRMYSKDQIESYIELKQEQQDRYRMTAHPVVTLRFFRAVSTEFESGGFPNQAAM